MQNTFGALGRELRRAMIKHEWLGQVLQIGVCAATAAATGGLGCAAFAGAMAWGMTGDLQAGLTAFAIGAIMPSAGGFGDGFILRAVQAGVMSGAISAAQGGTFKAGFVNSLKGSLAGAAGGSLGATFKTDNVYLGTSIAALVGGTMAKMTGGDFANGARSAAFSYIIANKGEFFAKKKAATASDPKNTPTVGCDGAGANPILFATGTKFLVMTDYQSTTKANGKGALKLVRYYTSDASQQTGFGLGWRSNFDRSLKFSGEGASSVAITAQRPNAQTRVFYSIEAGEWQAPSGKVEQLIQLQNSDSQEAAQQDAWQLITADNNVETYDASGRLIRITELGGYTQTLSYGNDAGATDVLLSVSDSYGQRIDFDYNYSGLIQAVQTPQGETRYQYDTRLNLVKVTDPDLTQTWSDNPYKQYHYDDLRFANAITRITDSAGRTLHRMAYEDHGYATLSTLGDDMEHYTVAYNDDGSRTHTNALGRQTTYFFDDHDRPTRVEGHATASCVGANKAYEYDNNGFLVSKTDWSDIETRFQYNDRGLMTQQTRAYGTPEAFTVEQQWHAEFRLPTRITTPGNTTELRYNEQGLLIEKTTRDTSTANNTNAANNTNPVAFNTLRRWIGMDSDNNSRTFTYTYNAQGQLATLDGPRTDVDDRSEFQYDLQGNRIAATNALGQTHQILAHNPQGLPTLMEDAHGLQIQLSYNAQGWLLSKTVGQATTTYQYDPVANYDGTGRVTQITAADGSWIQTHYNQGGKVIALQNNLGERQRYQLDRQGNPVQYESVDASNQLTQTFAKQYDALSRLTAQIGAHQQTVRYQYDPNDNLTAQTDALGHVTGYQYDSLNRLVATVDAHQNTAFQGYDAMGNLSQVIDPRGIVTHYRYNGFGELLQQQSADTGSTVNQYDATGNRIQSIDARGVLSEMSYDPLNRLTAIEYPASPDQNIHYQYQNGTLAQVEDATGSQHYQYDLNGRITQQQHQIEGQHYQVGYQYNAAGQLLNTTYPSGRVLNYHYDDLGRLSGIEQQHNPEANANIIVDQISYLPFGPRQGLRFGNGIEAQQQRDLDYRISVLSHVADAANDGTDGAVDDAADGNDTAERLHRQYQYDANNNIVAIENIVASQSSQQFEYDALNRLTQAEGGYGQLSYDYDAVGNRLSKTTTAANGLIETDTYLNTETYQYAETSNRLLAVQQANGIDLASTRQLSYSANGNIQQDLNAGNARQLIYNARNRLVEITEAGQTVALYGHNAQGQRVIKAVGERGQHFIYNQFDQLIAEANDQGVIEKEYVYLGNTAIAHIESANDAVYYYHRDHLGSAQMITDQTQQVVWAADYSPFGMLESGEGEDEGVGAVENNWRFPGQYADGESGYYYNYFRDYDPTLGRYLQSDPIGLGGGFNTFGYVGGNPNIFVDPRGLFESSTGAYAGGTVITPAGGVVLGGNLQTFSDGSTAAYKVSGYGYGWDIGVAGEWNVAFHTGDGGAKSWAGKFHNISLSALGVTGTIFWGSDWYGFSGGAATDGLAASYSATFYEPIVGPENSNTLANSQNKGRQSIVDDASGTAGTCPAY